MSKPKTRIVIAVADAIVGAGLSTLLTEDSTKPFEIYECASIAELLNKEDDFCQLLIVDAELQPPMCMLKQLSQKGASILLINPRFPIGINAHVANGVRGMMFRPISREGLRVAIETVLNGEVYVGPITSHAQCFPTNPQTTSVLANPENIAFGQVGTGSVLAGS